MKCKAKPKPVSLCINPSPLYSSPPPLSLRVTAGLVQSLWKIERQTLVFFHLTVKSLLDPLPFTLKISLPCCRLAS